MKIKNCVKYCFFYYFGPECDEFWAGLYRAESEENSPEQFSNICVSEKNSSETAVNRADYYLQKRQIQGFREKTTEKSSSFAKTE